MTAEVAKRRAELVLVTAATLLIAMVIWPLWRPLLIAAVLAGVLSPLYETAVGRLGGRRSLVGGAVHRRDRRPDPDSRWPCWRSSPCARPSRRSASCATRIASDGVDGLIEKAPDSIED